MRDDTQDLRDVLRRVALRLGLGITLRHVVRGALAASAALFLWALLEAVVPLPFPLVPLVWGLGSGLAAAIPILLWRLRPSASITARVVDRRLRLGDRLSTAVELLGGPRPPAGLARLQVADAVEAARGVRPREAAPVRIPPEAWKVAAVSGALVLWMYFLSGWSLPGTPASYGLAAIHREGRALVEVGRWLEAVGRLQGLPETRRAAPRILDLGRRLETARIARQDALALLRDEGRRLQAIQETVEHRLSGAVLGGSPAPRETPRGSASRPSAGAVQGAVRRLESLTGQLRTGGADGSRQDLSERLRAMSETLDQMNAPAAARRKIADARRELERGHLTEAGAVLGDALQDLRGLERMLEDEQALGDARRQVQSSAERIAEGGGGGSPEVTMQGPSPSGPPPSAPGSNPAEMGSAEGSPPPGPHQGSLPGQGPGGSQGAPTGRLQGPHVLEHLPGVRGEGDSAARDLDAPGQPGASRLPAVRPPRDILQQVDAALSRGLLPPAYLTIVRKYFEALGGGR